MGRVCSALLRGLLGSTRAGRNNAVIHRWIQQDLLNRLVDTVAIIRIGVVVADNDEPLARREATGMPLIVIDVAALAGCHVVIPKADLIGVAQTVTIFRPIEDGWRGVSGKNMNNFTINVDRYVPMALRREREYDKFR